MQDPAENLPKPRTARWRGWALNAVLIALILGGVQWWKARPLATGEAPPLAGITVTGQPLDLADYRGRPVMVHFWASWCPVCKVMDGTVESIAEEYPVITVAMQSGGSAEVRQFMRDAKLSFPVIPDAQGWIARRWGVAGVPTTFIVDQAGRIQYSTVGVSTGPGLRTRLWLAGQE